MFKLDHMPLARKMTMVMALFVLLAAGLTGYALDRISSLADNTTVLVNEHAEQSRLAALLDQQVGTIYRLGYEAALEEDPVKSAGISRELTATQAEFEQHLRGVEALPGEEALMVPEIRDRTARLIREINRAIAFARQGNQPAAEETLQLGAGPIFKEIDSGLRDMIKENEGHMAHAKSEAAELASASFWSMLIATVIGTVFVLGLALLMVRRKIAAPIAEITETMSALANDHIVDQVRFAERRDEIGAMARAVLVFRDAAAAKLAAEVAKKRIEEEQQLVVEQLGQGLARLSDGDLLTSLSGFPPAYANLEADFNRAIDQLRQALTAIHESSGSIHTGASEVDAASTDLSRRTEHQAASLEETAAAVNQINAALRQTAESAGLANAAVSKAREDAEQSGSVVRETIEAMQAIERDAGEISEIITVIDGIAFQTNLLALNAGVEAARAGEAGRGFAVVASEVRALAQRAADAAKDVKERISTSAVNVETGARLVTETGKALGRIAERINETSELVARISDAAGEQSSGLEQVSGAVGELDGVTQRNAAMVEEAAAASRSLADEAEALVKQVSRFDIGRATGESRRSTRKAAPPAPAKFKPARTASAPIAMSHGNLALAADADEDWAEF